MAKAILSSALLILFIASVANAQTTHRVGGGNGNWNTGVNYDTWASGTTFTAGDSLLFNYGPTHDVAEVNQADYDSCSFSSPISMDANSPTTITLPTAATRYFVCTRSNHCTQGMKVTVTVVASGGTTPSTPPPSGGTPTPATPETPGTPVTPGTPATPTPSTPAGTPGTGTNGNGAASLSGLTVGALSVAAVLGFMA